MLRVEALRAGAAAPALTFDVPHGKCIGVFGHDAAALQQISECLSGARVPVSGRVLVDDVDTSRNWNAARTRVSVYVPSATDRVTTAGEHVATIAAARGALRASVVDSMRRLGVNPHQPLTTGAAKAAAALVGALIADTSAIVLYEPFTALDASTRDKAILWIRELAESPVSIVMLSAIERDVRSVSHAVIDVGAGR